jgi:hypothetical protein
MLLDRVCSECGNREDDLYERGSIQEFVACPKCGSLSFKKIMTVPHIGREEIVAANHFIEKENEKCERTYEVKI